MNKLTAIILSILTQRFVFIATEIWTWFGVVSSFALGNCLQIYQNPKMAADKTWDMLFFFY